MNSRSVSMSNNSEVNDGEPYNPTEGWAAHV